MKGAVFLSLLGAVAAQTTCYYGSDDPACQDIPVDAVTSTTTTLESLTVTVLPVTSVTTTTATGIVSPILGGGQTGWDGIVTFTSTRTFTDYCGCGIPGVSTISVNPTLISTTTSTTTGTVSVNPTLISTTTTTVDVSTTFTSSGSTVILPDPTVTTSSTTTTTTTGTVTTSSSTTTTSAAAITTTTTTSSTTTTTTTSSVAPVVTDEAYIDTILRHHNVHRANHTVPALVWSPSLAETARKIGSTCNYNHNTTADGGGYGQNIGAGFTSINMGQFVTEGLYNPEVNSYTYYGGEPDTSTVGAWGHMSQIVWKSTTAVGCYTYDCSATGLQNAPGIPPYFTVCNYSPAGNVVGAFAQNVLAPVNNPTIFANYECPSRANCVGPTT